MLLVTNFEVDPEQMHPDTAQSLANALAMQMGDTRQPLALYTGEDTRLTNLIGRLVKAEFNGQRFVLVFDVLEERATECQMLADTCRVVPCCEIASQTGPIRVVGVSRFFFRSYRHDYGNKDSIQADHEARLPLPA